MGHDVYLFAMTPEKGFMLSDLGWLWDRYNQESLQSSRQILIDAQAEGVKDFMTFFLKQKAVLVLAILAGIIIGLTWGLTKIMNKSSGKDIQYLKKNQGKKGGFKYKMK